MVTFPPRDSGQFWVEKNRHLCDIVNSMREHGGFALVTSYWNVEARRDCVAELERLIAVLTDWKCAVQDGLSDVTQPIDPVAVREAASQASRRLRVAAAPPNLVLLPSKGRR